MALASCSEVILYLGTGISHTHTSMHRRVFDCPGKLLWPEIYDTCTLQKTGMLNCFEMSASDSQSELLNFMHEGHSDFQCVNFFFKMV